MESILDLAFASVTGFLGLVMLVLGFDDRDGREFFFGFLCVLTVLVRLALAFGVHIHFGGV